MIICIIWPEKSIIVSALISWKWFIIHIQNPQSLSSLRYWNDRGYHYKLNETEGTDEPPYCLVCESQKPSLWPNASPEASHEIAWPCLSGLWSVASLVAKSCFYLNWSRQVSEALMACRVSRDQSELLLCSVEQILQFDLVKPCPRIAIRAYFGELEHGFRTYPKRNPFSCHCQLMTASISQLVKHLVSMVVRRFQIRPKL